MLPRCVLNNRRILVINHSLKICTLNRGINKVVYSNFNSNFSPIRRKECSGMLFTVVGCSDSRVVRACADRPGSGVQLLGSL
jgi:hypothetical protein